jgi:UPF0755 protein
MKKIIGITVISIVLLCLAAGLLLFIYISSGGVPRNLEDPYVHIPTNSDFEEVVALLKEDGVIRNEELFRLLSEKMSYKRNPMRSGRFKVEPGWDIITLIRHLRGGPQAPVGLVLTNERLLEDVAGKAARFIEPDSAQFIETFHNDAYLTQIGYTRETLMSLFIPNTYEFYWNSSVSLFMERMIREHDSFWEKNGRKEKAEALGMTPQEVYTLASIVEKETLVESEKPRMAGVYLNRLEIGMRLQADPTSVFATRDFDTPRVTDYHTRFDSPYNTYKYAGLPPGPITMTSIGSIDAVLNAEEHDYLYFCAVGDGSSLHAFAKTLAAHNQNVARYRENLKKRGLR